MFGVLIMAAGLLLLIQRHNLADVYLSSRLWPLFPLGLGLLRVIDPPQDSRGRVRSRRSGAWLVFLGCWGLVNEFHMYGFRYENSWPLMVIFAGLSMVWRSTARRPRTNDGTREA